MQEGVLYILPVDVVKGKYLVDEYIRILSEE